MGGVGGGGWVGGGRGGGGQVRCNREVKFFVKINKTKLLGGGGVGSRGGGGSGVGRGQGGCERRIQGEELNNPAFVLILFFIHLFIHLYSNVTCIFLNEICLNQRRIEVFVKIQKKKNWEGGDASGRGGGGVRVGGDRLDVNEELKFL